MEKFGARFSLAEVVIEVLEAHPQLEEKLVGETDLLRFQQSVEEDLVDAVRMGAIIRTGKRKTKGALLRKVDKWWGGT